MVPDWTTARSCRSCGDEALAPLISLGATPLADRLVRPDAPSSDDPRVPLDMVRCLACSLAQLAQTVRRDLLFGEGYAYHSSISSTVVDNARSLTQALLERGLVPGSRVVEPASNDGYLLRQLAEKGARVLGIDPSPGPAAAARASGVPTRSGFLDEDLATELRAEGHAADFVVANNVLGHVEDPNGFLRAITAILEPDGLLVVEVPYLFDLIDGCEFDTIYHQHLCYFSLTALETLLGRHGLFINDLERLAIHGGSLRLFVSRLAKSSDSVSATLAEEAARGVATADPYESFARRVDRVGDDLLKMLHARRSAGRRIAAYGAAAKGTTLLSVCGIGRDLIDYVVDANPAKHGLAMPGCRLPIRPVEALSDEPPDDVLLLAWNHAAEIVESQHAYRERGGRFIVPLPEPRVL